jgi:vesicle coat complex subunit
VSGSQVRINVAGSSTVAMQSHGTAFLTFASGSGVDNSVTIAPVGATTANLLNTVATTVNFAGAATTLAIATTPTTTQNVNIATGVTSTGNTKTINLGTGGAAGSTTNIVLGSTAGGGTITANENLVPGAANTYDLGAVDNRWRNIYTGDLHLKNDRGNWTIVEEAEFLSITNNLSGKRYKFVLEEI